MKNVFTIDTEDWFHANFEDSLFSNTANMQSTVEENVDRYLEIFSENNVKATFFVLGFIVEQHPDLIRKIASQGHEIASHGYAHQLVYKQSPQEFRQDVYKSKILLEDLIGQSIIGYRAPSWSITEQSLWALDILDEMGFEYNSAIFPTKNFLYRIPYAPRFLHDTSVYGKRNLKMLVIPPSTRRFGSYNIPFSGGAYFRLMPAWLIKRFTDDINAKEKEPVIFYLHPREIDPKQPKLKLNFKEHMIHYYGIRHCEKKLTDILRQYEFETMKELLNHRLTAKSERHNV